MARITLTDSPRWFNDSTATKFDEDSRWDGNNHISRATGSQWDHQALYYTASGRWILNSWSQWQGTEDTYEEVSQADAIEWLISQDVDNDEISSLPATVRQAIKDAVASAEL